MARVDAASRMIAASRERVYAALVDPAALLVWLPPDGMTARFEHVDVRAGGSYRLVLTYPDGTSAPGKSSADTDVVESRYLELVPGARVVQAVDFASEDPAFGGTMRMTWEVGAVEGGCRVELRAEDVPSGISPEDHRVGLASSLANLAAYLER